MFRLQEMDFFSGGGGRGRGRWGCGGSACSPASKKSKSVSPPTPMQPAHLRSLIKVFHVHKPFIKLVKLNKWKSENCGLFALLRRLI